MLRLKFNNWIFHHRISSAESLSRVLSRPFGSFIICCLIAMTLAFPISGSLLVKNLESLISKVIYEPSLSVFLDDQIPESKGRQIAESIRNWEQIKDLEFLTAESALLKLGEDSGFGDLLLRLDTNPIPATLLLTLDSYLSYEDSEALGSQLLAIPEISNVIIDHAWLERLKNFLALGYRIIFLLTISLGLAAAIVISSMVKLAIENRREEIVVIKLVGGSDAFLRRPFLYMGLWYGFGGGVLASNLVIFAEALVISQVDTLMLSYQSEYKFISLRVVEAVNIAALGGVLGILGAWGAVIRHIPQIEP